MFCHLHFLLPCLLLFIISFIFSDSVFSLPCFLFFSFSSAFQYIIVLSVSFFISAASSLLFYNLVTFIAPNIFSSLKSCPYYGQTLTVINPTYIILISLTNNMPHYHMSVSKSLLFYNWYHKHQPKSEYISQLCWVKFPLSLSLSFQTAVRWCTCGSLETHSRRCTSGSEKLPCSSLSVVACRSALT